MNPNTLLLPHVWPRAEPADVAHCAMLAVLVHVWLVLSLGNAPGGTARPGEGVWGAVNVTLRGPQTPGAADLPTPPKPAVATGPVGQAETPRWGGAVRAQTAPELPAEPGAAQLGDWAPLPAAAEPQPALAPPPRAPALRSTLPTGPLPEPGRVVEERAVAPLPVPVPVSMPALPTTPAPAPALAPVPVPVPVLAPAVATPTPMPVPQPPPERSLASSLSRRASAAAAEAQALPTTASAVPAPTLARLPDLTAPSAGPLMAPRVAPPMPSAPVAALPSTPPLAVPYAAADLPPAALKNLVAAPQSVAALPRSLAAPTTVTQPVAAALLPPAVAATSPINPPINPLTASLPTGVAPAGTADAGSRLGHDVAGAPALPASAPPRLNLQLARPRGGEISRGLGGGVLAVLPRPPEVDDKLGQQIAKSAKVDCRSAYAAAGLLAVVPLAVEALRKDSTCRW